MNKRQLLAWILLALFAIFSLMQGLVANLLPTPVRTGLVTFLPLVFLFVHGSLSYRLRDLFVFAAVTLVVSNFFENLSVLTGFPFGNYLYSDVLGPKLFLVPVLIGPAYLGTGYLSWTMARVILGATNGRLWGHFTVTVPLIASLLMVSWDLAMDPLYSTIFRGWVWQDGGSYFGVPFSNFLGWLLTTFVFFQLFALYLKGRPNLQSTGEPPRRHQSLQAILFYGLIAARYILNGLTGEMSGTVTDPAGMVWRLQDIYTVTGLVALFTMGAFTLLGVVKLMSVSPEAQPAAAETSPDAAAPYRLTHQPD